jgi:hypothetical protein
MSSHDYAWLLSSLELLDQILQVVGAPTRGSVVAIGSSGMS